jgi:circadian clock protein KaiB
MPGKSSRSKGADPAPSGAPVPVRFEPPTHDATREFERRLEEGPEATFYQLRLYITGTTQRSMTAIASIRALCEQFLAGNFELEVVDIYQQPLEAAQQQIIAAPTLVRESPAPTRRIVGDLSDTQKVLASLELLMPVRPPEGPADTGKAAA